MLSYPHILLLLSCYRKLFAFGFTKDIRTVSVAIDGYSIPLVIDNVLTGLESIIHAYCITERCIERSGELVEQIGSTIDLQARGRLPVVIQEYLDKSNNIVVSTNERSFLTHSDNHTVLYFTSVAEEVRSLQRGSIASSERCLSLQHTEPSNLAREGCSMLVVFPRDIYGAGTVVNNTLDFWVLSAERLFNQLHYDHAEAIGYFLMKFSVDSGLDLSTDEYFIKGLTILAEVAREKGSMSSAVYFNQMVICSYEKISKSRPILHRLRLLMTVPPLPPKTALSLRQRRVMVDDLYLFQRELQRTGIVMTIQDLLSDISATPFHIAHQGINDRDIQEALAKVYLTMCPELSYTAPHLRRVVPIHLDDGDDDKIPIVKESSATAEVQNNVLVDADASNSKVIPHDMNMNGLDGRVNWAAAASVSQSQYTSAVAAKRDDYEDNNDGRVRLGFVSSHFFEHSIGRMMIELFIFMHERRNVYKRPIELTVFFTDSTVSTEQYDRYLAVKSALDSHDPEYNLKLNNLKHALCRKDDAIVNIMIDRLGESFHCLPPSISRAREAIGQYHLDFLVFADLGMDFISYGIAFARLAKYQAAWWGHPITSGIDTIDYFFGLDIEVPDAGPMHYSEQLIRMEVMNSAPIRKLGRTPRPLPEESTGIPEDAKICLVLGRLFKLHPDFDKAVAQILLESPHDTVVVLVAEKIFEWNDAIYKRIEKALVHAVAAVAAVEAVSVSSSTPIETTGDGSRYESNRSSSSSGGMVNELVGRYIAKLRFVSYNYYSDLLLTAPRVVLDTFPYGGCLTTHDALSNAAPMVTLPLEHVRGRYTLGMYRQMGLSDLIANSTEHYVQLVKRLLEDDEFHKRQVYLIASHYENLHRNEAVADEWLNFIIRLV